MDKVQTVQDPNFLQSAAIFMNEGGLFMWIIFAAWCMGLVIILERLKALHQYDINGAKLMTKVKKHVLENNVLKAIEICSNSKSVLGHVLKSGLKRANQSKEQIQDATEASVLEITPKVENRLSYLALVANVSTLLGLLGTIQGLIESFAAVADADPAAKAKLLALGISKAMNTTAFGLISAISIMVVHQYLSNKSEKILASVDEHSMKLVDLLGTKKNNIQIKQQESNPDQSQRSDDESKEELPSIPQTA